LAGIDRAPNAQANIFGFFIKGYCFRLAIFLFIKDQGVYYGAIYLGASGIAFGFIGHFFDQKNGRASIPTWIR
jgi:hypothetical protein